MAKGRADSQRTSSCGDKNQRAWDAGLVGLLDAQAAQTPHATAVLDADRTLTYQQFTERANRLANHLRQQGVSRSAVIAVFMERSVETVLAFHGILRAGAAYLPLEPAYPAKRVAAMLDDGKPQAILTTENLRRRLPQTDSRFIFLDNDKAFGCECSGTPVVQIAPDDLAYVLFTSGSTGRPKGAMIPHRAILNHIKQMQEAFPLCGEDTLLHKTPLGFDASFWEILWPLLAGAKTVVAKPEGHYDVAYITSLIRRFNVTTIHFVPSVLREFVREPEAGRCSSLVRVLCGGEALTATLQDRLLEILPCDLYNLYGPTETAIAVTMYDCGHRASAGTVPVGRPLANTAVYILDAELRPVAPGAPGELYIGGVQVGLGYINSPQLSAEHFLPDPVASEAAAVMYKTGDLGRFLPDGNIEYLGRVDNQIKLRGQRVELEEIEAAISCHPAVHAAAVKSWPSTTAGQYLAAYYVAPDDITRNELVGHLSVRLPAYMVPQVFIRLKALPLLSNGKLDRLGLPEPETGERVLTREYAEPSSDFERFVAELWSEVLDVPRPGCADDFFQLGGHSLLAVRFCNEVRSRCGVEIPLRLVFDTPRLSDIASALERIHAAADSSSIASDGIEPAPRRERMPLTFSQEQLWFLQQVQPSLLAYNIPVAMRFQGSIDYEKLSQALQTVMNRHEALRTTFGSADGAPFACVHDAMSVSVEKVELRGRPVENARREAEEQMMSLAQTPFNLERGPMVLARLFSIADEEHCLCLVIHHIVFDGWSAGILAEELIEAYCALRENRKARLRPIPIQQVDLACWQKNWYTANRLNGDIGFFRQLLEGSSSYSASPRPAVAAGLTRPAAEVMSRLAPGTLQKLDEARRNMKTTRYVLLLAAWQILTGRYRGSKDVVTGSAFAGRDLKELEPVVGFFVNTVPIRTSLEGHRTVRDLVQSLQDEVMRVREHQYAPLELITAEAQPGRSATDAPLVRDMFVLQNAPKPQLSFPGGTATVETRANGEAKFELVLEAYEEKDALSFRLEYDASLYTHDSARAMLDNYATVLDSLLQAPDTELHAISVLSPAERHRYFDFCLGERIDDLLQQSLVELLDARTAAMPDNTALVDETRCITYRELTSRANQLANELQKRGVSRNSVVALFLERSIETVIAVHAVLRAGGAYLPIEPEYPEARISEMLEDAQPELIVTSYVLRDRLPNRSCHVLCLDEAAEAIAHESTEAPDVAIAPEDLAYVVFTSGSTGRPKGARIPHRAVCNHIQRMQDVFPLDQEDVLFHKTPLGFDASVWEVLWPLFAGAKVVVAKPGSQYDIAYTASAIREFGVTTIHLVPSVLREFLAEPKTGQCSSLKRVLCGGETLPAELRDQFFETLRRCDLYNLYGPSETTVAVTAYHCGSERAESRVPIGRPMPNTAVYILDEDLRPVPVGAPGEMFVGGVQVGLGYINRPKLTNGSFLPDPFACGDGATMYKSGDIGRFLEDGNIEYLGRVDNQIKLRGHRIELEEIENCMLSYSAVKAAAARTWQDSATGLCIAAYYVCDGSFSEGDLAQHLMSKLPRHMIPKDLIRVTELPLLANGKLDRQKLPKPVHSGQDRGVNVPPRTDAEQTMATLWAGLLGVETVGAFDDFFELGGHSLLVTRLVAHIERVFGVRLPVKTVFEKPQLASLARAVEETILDELEAAAESAGYSDQSGKGQV